MQPKIYLKVTIPINGIFENTHEYHEYHDYSSKRYVVNYFDKAPNTIINVIDNGLKEVYYITTTQTIFHGCKLHNPIQICNAPEEYHES